MDAQVMIANLKKKTLDLVKCWDRWFPPKVKHEEVEKQLATFYEQSREYHAMTRSGDKSGHPQVLILLSLLSPGGE